MNKKLKILVVSLVILIATAIIFVILRSDEQTLEQAPTPTASTTAHQDTAAPAGSYIAYSEQAVNEAVGGKFLFFYAPWCPQCRSIEAGMTAEAIPEGVTIFKVDYDSNQALRKKYGVTLQTTFVKLDERGEVAGKYVAYDEPTFEAVKQNFLNQ